MLCPTNYSSSNHIAHTIWSWPCSLTRGLRLVLLLSLAAAGRSRCKGVRQITLLRGILHLHVRCGRRLPACATGSTVWQERDHMHRPSEEPTKAGPTETCQQASLSNMTRSTIGNQWGAAHLWCGMCAPAGCRAAVWALICHSGSAGGFPGGRGQEWVAAGHCRHLRAWRRPHALTQPHQRLLRLGRSWRTLKHLPSCHLPTALLHGLCILRRLHGGRCRYTDPKGFTWRLALLAASRCRLASVSWPANEGVDT